MKARTIMATLLAAASIAGHSVAQAAPPPEFWEFMVNEPSMDDAAPPPGDEQARMNCGPAAGMPHGRDYRGEPQGRPLMRGQYCHPACLSRLLDLNDEQKTRIASVLKEEREKASALFGKKAAAHGELRQLEHAADLDEKALRGAAGELAGVETELIVSRAKARNRIMAILTPAQRELLDRLGPAPEQRPGPPPPPKVGKQK